MGKGKGSKVAWSLIGFAVGFYNPGMFGITDYSVFFGAGLMGASLAGSLWSTMNGRQQNTGTPSVQRFSKAHESMSSGGALPIVYGMRKITGNQTFHETNSDQNVLHKHVVLCEGGIEGIVSVSADDLLIPTGTQTNNTVFTLQNTKYQDASVRLSKKHLYLTANGSTRDLYLCNKDDGSNADTYWSWQMNIEELISYINRLNEGWQAFPIATTNKYPGDLFCDDPWEYVDTVILNEEHSVGDTFDRDGYHYEVVSCDSRDTNTGWWHLVTCKRYKAKTSSAYLSPINMCASTVTGGTTYAFHDGDIPSNYDVVGGYPNMAWLDMTFKVSDELNGNPSVSCIIKGRKVYNMKTGATEYSTNPAWCLADFLCSKRYGMGLWFDYDVLDKDSFSEAADWFDTMGYELNMIVDTKRNAIDWIQSILSCCQSYLVISQGKVKLCAEKPTAVSYAFNDDNCYDLSIHPLSLDDSPNRYKVKIIDPLNNWTDVCCVKEDLADQRLRGKVIEKSVELDGVTSQKQALRLARFYRDYNLVCALSVTISTGAQAMHLEPGDVITVSYHNVVTELPIRIEEISEKNDGTYTISGRQYNGDIYTVSEEETIQFYKYTSADSSLAGEVPNVTDVVATPDYYINNSGKAVSTISLTYTIPDYLYNKRWKIYYSVNGSDWTFYKNTVEDKVVFNDAVLFRTYKFKIVSENTSGRLSSGVESSDVYTDGKNNPPTAPKNVNVQEYYGGVLVSWTANTEDDLAGYNVYYRIGDGDIIDFQKKFNGTSVLVPVDAGATYTFYVSAIDNCNNESARSSSQFTFGRPSDVTMFDIVQTGSNLDFRWQKVDGAGSYEIRRGTSWGTSELVVDTGTNYYSCLFPIAGSHDFWIKSLSQYGTYSLDATKSTIKVISDNDRNSLYNIDEVKLGWTGTLKDVVVKDSGLTLQGQNTIGEITVPVELPSTATCRNWLDSLFVSIDQDDKLTWENAKVAWKDAGFQWVPAGEQNGIGIEHKIAIYKGDSSSLVSIPLNGSLDGATVESSKHVSYAEARYDNGLVVNGLTSVTWKVDVPKVFGLGFYIKINEKYNGSAKIITLCSGDSSLQIWYNFVSNTFDLVGSDGKTVSVDAIYDDDDYVKFGISQTDTIRRFFMFSYRMDTILSSSIEAAPIGAIDKLQI